MAKSKTPASRASKSARASLPVRTTAWLIPLAVWLAVTPYVAPAFGYTLTLDPAVEVIDHVVPGVVVVAASIAALLLRRHPSAVTAFTIASALSMLGGLWATATHVPLLAQAAQGLVSWGAAFFHSTPGVVLMVVALLALVPVLRNAD